MSELKLRPTMREKKAGPSAALGMTTLASTLRPGVGSASNARLAAPHRQVRYVYSQVKLAASLGSPLPLYLACWG